MNISQVRRRIIEKLSSLEQPISRFELMELVLKPEMDTFQTVLVEFIDMGDIQVTVDWQLRLYKEK